MQLHEWWQALYYQRRYFGQELKILMIMNDKEKLFYHVVEVAARCCSYTLKDGRQSITVADVLGKSRRENVQLTRNIAVGLLVALGFTVSTCAVGWIFF